MTLDKYSYGIIGFGIIAIIGEVIFLVNSPKSIVAPINVGFSIFMLGSFGMTYVCIKKK